MVIFLSFHVDMERQEYGGELLDFAAFLEFGDLPHFGCLILNWISFTSLGEECRLPSVFAHY